MVGTLSRVTALLLSVGILLTGHGLQLTLLPVHAQALGWSTYAIGLSGSLYFLGFVLGCIVFAEQHIFPRLGYKSNWHRLKGVRNNKPALITWAVCLVFGFGLDSLDVIPFVYLFLPTWVVSLVCYTVLAKPAGADKSYPEAEQREQEFDSKVKAYHARLATQESHAPVKDTSLLTKLIRAVWIVIGLIVPFVLAWRVLFNSPNLYDYYVNRELFYDLTIWCTLIYFVFAWWDLQRGKALSGDQVTAEAVPAS